MEYLVAWGLEHRVLGAIRAIGVDEIRPVEKNHPKPRRQYVAAWRRDHSHVNEDPHLRKVAAEQLVRNVIHEDGGPLIHNGWEDEQRSFDSTCRKFHRFLSQSQR